MQGTFAARKNICSQRELPWLRHNARTVSHEKMRAMTAPFSRPAIGPFSGLRVLVVDDCAEDRMLLMDFLSGQGCRVYIAVDGHDGYRKAQLVVPDLVLMDVTMPSCDGLAACRLIKADQATRNIPLIFLSAAVLPAERVAGLAAGAVDYVTKPFDFEEVRLRLLVHLRNSLPMAAAPAVAPDAAQASPTLDGVLFRAARRMLSERLDYTPELDELAHAVGTNARRLNLAFRRCAGATVFEFLREERMREARRLLCETVLDVQAIAQSVGYGNRGNFSTAFRERFGMSPSALRQAPGADG
ncbi:phosphate regulon two-component response regulator [Bordetella ansorpii]|uniref:Phosphate regulon two-component response regulator n=2 Tax=Bordetella ansorpii TaxID=288768 RepID=A0A157NST7_9BORD|nr:phosphate regulon two-component response regulator [Bordetella ansorpii]